MKVRETENYVLVHFLTFVTLICFDHLSLGFLFLVSSSMSIKQKVVNMAKEDTEDHKGLNKSCILVLAVAGVERFAFKGVASNLVTYLTEVVKMSNSSAAKTVNSWCGASFLLPLLGAFLADSYLDRYSTMRVSSILYVAGLVALTSTAFVLEWTTKSSSGLPASSLSTCLFWSLFFISLGQGGYNPCLQAFGAEQLETDEELLPCNKDSDDQSSKRKSLFFKWSYFGICSGSFLGISLMSYFQDILGWGLGFGIPTIAMAISVAPFMCGSRFYTLKQPKSTAGEKHFQNLLQSIKAIASKLINRKNIELPSKLSETIELELQAKPLCNNDSESLEKNPNNGTEPIEDTKSILRLMPIWTMLLVFAIIFQQPSTFFTKQGMTMKRNIGKSFTIPPATLQSAINVSVILLMLFYDKTIIPISRIITRDKRGITVMQRMGVGMFLSILAMGIAAIVETKRLEISRRTSKELEPAVPMSIFWLLPQYSLLGFSDVFTVVGMQEFFYTEVPSGKKTVGMALHLSVFGIGSFLSALLISFIEIITSHGGEKKHSWFSDDMNEARLDSFYWLLALSSALSLFFFVVLCKQYNRRNAST